MLKIFEILLGLTPLTVLVRLDTEYQEVVLTSIEEVTSRNQFFEYEELREENQRRIEKEVLKSLEFDNSRFLELFEYQPETM